MDSPAKVPCQSKNSDRIGNLPEEITHNILCRLPIRDVVRTSILSRNWRRKWITLPHLVFDVSTFPPQLQDDEGKYAEVIYSILLGHKGPISKFSLCVKTMTRYSKIDQWLLLLSDKGAITELALRFIDRSRYKIHSSLFSYASLRKLKLRCCIIPSPLPSIFNGFNELTFVELEGVTFNNEGLENLIARCPRLCRLHLRRIDGVDRLNIHHAPNLQSLHFAANLIKYISLMGAPRLLSATFASSQLPDMNDQNLEINNLNCLSNLLKLTLGSYYLKFLAQDSVRQRLPSTFNNLSYLVFFKLMFEDMDSVYSALYLIRSSPNIQQFVVVASTNSSAAEAQMKTVTEYLEAENRSIGSLMQLKYIEMTNIKGLGPEMQFIKMILGKSPLLKEMKIQYDQKVTACPITESKILRELIRFPRASTMAEIVC